MGLTAFNLARRKAAELAKAQKPVPVEVVAPVLEQPAKKRGRPPKVVNDNGADR